MKKTAVIILVLLNFLLICSCTKSDITPPVVSTQKPISGNLITAEIEKYSFKDLVSFSDAAFLGEYVEMMDYDSYVEYKFIVKDCLYGNVTDKEIYLYSLKASLHSEDNTYNYVSGEDIYKAGNDYMLVTERYQSIMYDHDRYLLAADIILDETEGKYVMFSEPLMIPEGESLREYILSIYDSVPHEKEPPHSEKVYTDSHEEMMEESDFVGTIDIIALMNEKKGDNSNIYICKASSLSKGDKLYTYEDGTFLLSLMKGDAVNSFSQNQFYT